VFGVDAETHVDFDGLVELCEFDFLDERDGLFELVFLALDLFQRSLILFAWFTCHVSSLVQAVRFQTGKRTSH
jgi:hypothetical protein